ncbi:DUF2726 domain-containing protein [Shewanella avicenniae]|uniref:DUF2726 domain-containing protein n=1 Tax=Shewanella avicenniae TaxID=2814294 RepID=A0ABX7QLA8_9GAMM|nr:DUF2726 domain-containing protein [Shewanella avicenniae]QSX32169.1 DUF2726 domain-containing protein [Shewanella avicenniae]
MDIALLFLLTCIVLLIVIALLGSKPDQSQYTYQSTQFLLTKAERSFYGALVQAVGNDALVFAKVRIADVLVPISGMNRTNWQRAFNKVSSKHFDFVLCNKDDCSLILGVELDDASHNTKKVQQRDEFVNRACASAGFTLLRVKAARSYVLADLRQLVKDAISTSCSTANEEVIIAPEAYSDVPTANEEYTAQLKQTVEKTEEVTSRTCPKCGEPMVLRTAKSGSNAGHEFWGCSAFPKCRCILD